MSIKDAFSGSQGIRVSTVISVSAHTLQPTPRTRCPSAPLVRLVRL